MRIISNVELNAVSGGLSFAGSSGGWWDDFGNWSEFGGGDNGGGGGLYRPMDTLQGDTYCHAHDSYIQQPAQPAQPPAPGSDAIKSMDFATPKGVLVAIVKEIAGAIFGGK